MTTTDDTALTERVRVAFKLNRCEELGAKTRFLEGCSHG